MIKPIVFALLATASTLSFAGPKCTEQDRSEWMTEEAMKAQIAAEGYQIKKFKITSGNCYEIYGYDTQNQKVEIYYHPVTGEVVKKEID